ncbi:hypothetical protein FACS1894214_2620 [Planctomycetales bacterium]|nr:hypothetical protein FACS1894214_2620 [Planctomycetales bacterium]
MQVFHGSYKKIIEIDLAMCRPNTDFGQGFYVTNIRTQAEFWAKRSGRSRNTDGIITEFVYYENKGNDCGLEVKKFADYNEEWLDFIVRNRNPETAAPFHRFDIVEGPVANDDVAGRIADYLEGEIIKTDFLKELTYHKPTHQICFCSLQSLQLLVYTGEEQKKKTEIRKLSQRQLAKFIAEEGLSEIEALKKIGK